MIERAARALDRAKVRIKPTAQYLLWNTNRRAHHTNLIFAELYKSSVRRGRRNEFNIFAIVQMSGLPRLDIMRLVHDAKQASIAHWRNPREILARLCFLALGRRYERRIQIANRQSRERINRRIRVRRDNQRHVCLQDCHLRLALAVRIARPYLRDNRRDKGKAAHLVRAFLHEHMKHHRQAILTHILGAVVCFLVFRRIAHIARNGLAIFKFDAVDDDIAVRQFHEVIHFPERFGRSDAIGLFSNPAMAHPEKPALAAYEKCAKHELFKLRECLDTPGIKPRRGRDVCPPLL